MRIHKTDRSISLLNFSRAGLFLFLFTSLIFFSIQVASATDPKPLPSSLVVRSKLNRLEDAIEQMYVTDAYSTGNSKVVSGVAINDVELEAMNRFIDSVGLSSKKRIVLIRYGLGDARFFDSLLRAKQKGLLVQVITDCNRSMDYNFKAEQKSSTDFENATLLKNSEGVGLGRLLAGGFRFNSKTAGVFSQPIFAKNPDAMIDIMHEKALLLIDENKSDGAKSEFFFGTNNLTDHDRYGRLLKMRDQDAAQYYLKHAENMMATFAKGESISQIASLPPLKIMYKDHSYQELAFTDGKYNPNDRIASILKKAAELPKVFEVNSLVLSHFVVTHTESVKKLKEAVKAQNFKIRGVVDSKFFASLGFGLSPTLQGYDVIRPLGRPVLAEGPAVVSNSELKVYQAPARDAKTGEVIRELNPEGAPTERKVWHDKSTVIRMTVGGKKQAFIFTGSLNLSNHFANAEFQNKMAFREPSGFVDSFEQSILKVAALQPDLALSPSRAIARQTIAKFTSRSDLEISLAEADEFIQSLLDRNYEKLLQLLKKIAPKPTQIEVHDSVDEVNKRITQLKMFLEWYQVNVPLSGQTDDERVRKFGLILHALIPQNKELYAYEKAAIVNGVIWRPNLSEERIQSLSATAWKVLGFDYSMPKRPIGAPLTSTRISVFDWDDNIMNMPTQIILFRKGTDVEFPVSTAQFADIRGQIGNEGEWAEYEIRSGSTESYRYFKDGGSRNYFLEDIQKALAGDASVWQAPSWKNFVAALDTPDSALGVSILTARSQSPETILEGLKALHSAGLIQNIPPLENIHAVGGAQNTAAEKLQVIRSLLEQVQIQAAREGTRSYRKFGFSDDDVKNFTLVRDELLKDVSQGKYANVKVSLFFTGKMTDSNRERVPESQVVLGKDGQTRKPRGNEVVDLFGEAQLPQQSNCALNFLPLDKGAAANASLEL